MIIPDYRNFKHLNELYHYGMPKRSGRYPYGSGDRPYQRLERKVARMENRLTKRFDKADKSTSKIQTKSNKKFNKSNEQRNSIFESRRSKAQDTLDEALTLQEKKQRIEYRMSKMYEKYQKKFDIWDVTMDKNLKKKGKEYLDKVLNTNDELYKAALQERIS